MLKNLRGSLLVFCGLGAISAAVIACSGGVTAPGAGGTSGSVVTPEPQQQAEITAPSGLKVSASIAAASLGEECGSGGALKAPSQKDCAEGGCTSYCQQSNVQIAFNARAGSKAAVIRISKVELVDSATGIVVDTLTASKPQAWNGSAYAAWDQNVTPGGDLKASYDLTAPKWSTIDSSTAKGTSSWSKSYKLHVTLTIEGIEVILESTDLNRQPVAVT